MTANTNMATVLSKKQQEGLIQFHKQCYQMLNQQWNIREQLRQVDLAFMRELDYTQENIRARLANMYGDPSRFQNITMPIVAPAVENAVAYQASIFLTGDPLFPVVADPTNQDAAMQMQTIIDNQATRGNWVRQLLLFFADGFKYNLSAIEVSWKDIVTPAFETDMSYHGGKQGKPKEVIWSGNCLERWDPYNIFFDSRYTPAEIPERGEFCGTTKLYTRTELKTFINQLPYKITANIVPAFESGGGFSAGGYSPGGVESYFIPQVNPWALINKNPRATTDWMMWAGVTGGENKIQYKNMYEVTTLYARLIPSDFNLNGVPSPNTPQIWKLIIVNHQVLIFAERQTNAHNLIPVLFGQPKEDGLMYQTKSLAQNVRPFQDVNSALINSMIHSRRRSISDRVLYDPSRVSEKHINSENPSAKIPVRPAAYGKPLQEAVYPFPFNDNQLPDVLQCVQFIQGLSNQLVNMNSARQGQFTKGNRTMHEYSDIMAHAQAPDQVIAMLYEAQVFSKVKLILKTNNMQFQAGDRLYNRQSKQIVTIDPIKLRQAICEFKIADGLKPSDQVINADTLQVMMQMMGTPGNPLAQQFDLGQLMTYFLKTQGANVNDFRKPPQQVAYESALQSWQQSVQVVMEGIQTIIRAAAPEQFTQLMSEMQKMIPPQPQPQQFGYNPNQDQAQGSQVAPADAQQSNQTALGQQMAGAVSSGSSVPA
jgi:hypothetical protein